jgi:hypothetical protein
MFACFKREQICCFCRNNVPHRRSFQQFGPPDPRRQTNGNRFETTYNDYFGNVDPGGGGGGGGGVQQPGNWVGGQPGKKKEYTQACQITKRVCPLHFQCNWTLNAANPVAAMVAIAQDALRRKDLAVRPVSKDRRGKRDNRGFLAWRDCLVQKEVWEMQDRKDHGDQRATGGKWECRDFLE